MKKKKLINNDCQLLLYLEENREARDYVKTLLAVKPPIDWRGMPAVPAGSILDIAVSGWHKETNIPLELPYFIVLHLLSHWLMSTNTKIRYGGSVIYPDLWTILLAESGAGKTFTESNIRAAAEIDDIFPEVTSSAQFLTDLQEYCGKLLICDEFAQFLSAMETQTYRQEMKGYLLRAYDHNRIERRTKKSEPVVIVKPMISILGMNVTATFLQKISMESMLDGFAQRFAYIIAKKDLSRPFHRYQRYDVSRVKDSIRAEWHTLQQLQIHDEYIVSTEADNVYRQTFSDLYESSCNSDNESVPESFYRRILWRSAQYALLYHVLLKKDSPTIDAQDMAWGLRVCEMGLQDGRELIIEHGMPELAKQIHKIEKLAQKLGRLPTPREVVQYIWSIKSVYEAQQLLSLIASNFSSGSADKNVDACRGMHLRSN